MSRAVRRYPVTVPTRAGSSYVNRLIEAMERGNLVDFMYAGKYRVVEVHAVGTSPKDGSYVMRGYQVGGQASRPLPQWTLFTVTSMELLEDKPTSSEAPREGYAMGDKQMATIIAELAL